MANDEFTIFEKIQLENERFESEGKRKQRNITVLNDDIDFLAKNESRANRAFIERSEYRDDAFPELTTKPIDLWYNKGLYGKVDPHYNSVVTTSEWKLSNLITEVIKKIPGEGQEVFAMNFVVDAFEDFQGHMNNAANRGQIHDKGSVFAPMTPTRGWSPVDTQYREYLDVLYEGFAATYLKQNQNYKKVNNFTSFMKVFSDFIAQTMPDFPISKSGYVLSNNYPITATGLAIELADANHGDDEKKYTEFISDKNFMFYVGAAQKFGFRVDKNAPWRLIADIRSQKMHEYMMKYPKLPPTPIPAGEAPTPPCVHFHTLFDRYRNKKVEFRGEAGPGIHSMNGFVSDVVCADEQGDYRFILQSTCPGDELDLLDPSTIPIEAGAIPKITWAKTFVSSEVINSRSTVSRNQEDSGLSDLVNLISVELQTVGDTSPGRQAYLNGWAAGQFQDEVVFILLGNEGGEGWYEWELSVKPPGHTSGLLSLAPNPPGVANGARMRNPRIGFKPDVVGRYEFKLHAINPEDGSRIAEVPSATAEFSWCTTTEQEWNEQIGEMGDEIFKGIYGVRDLYIQLRQDFENILGIPLYINGGQVDNYGRWINRHEHGATSGQGTGMAPPSHTSVGGAMIVNGRRWQWAETQTDAGEAAMGKNNEWAFRYYTDWDYTFKTGWQGVGEHFLKTRSNQAGPVMHYIMMMVGAYRHGASGNTPLDIPFANDESISFVQFEPFLDTWTYVYTFLNALRNTVGPYHTWRSLLVSLRHGAWTRYRYRVLENVNQQDFGPYEGQRASDAGRVPFTEDMNWFPLLNAMAMDLYAGNALQVINYNRTSGYDGDFPWTYLSSGDTTKRDAWLRGGPTWASTPLPENYYGNEAGVMREWGGRRAFIPETSVSIDRGYEFFRERWALRGDYGTAPITPPRFIELFGHQKPWQSRSNEPRNIQATINYLKGEHEGTGAFGPGPGPIRTQIDNFVAWAVSRADTPCSPSVTVKEVLEDIPAGSALKFEDEIEVVGSSAAAGEDFGFSPAEPSKENVDAGDVSEDDDSLIDPHEEPPGTEGTDDVQTEIEVFIERERLNECTTEVVKSDVAPASMVWFWQNTANASQFNWSLRNEDDQDFNERRRGFLQYVINYPSRLQAYQQRAAAWADWHRLEDAHRLIHERNIPEGPLEFENLFKRQLVQTLYLDIPVLTEYVLDVYNSYVMSHPVISTTKIKKGGSGTIRCLQEKKMITKQQMMRDYTDADWAKFYFALRIAESRHDTTSAIIKNFQVRIEQILSRLPSQADSIQRSAVMKQVLHFINDETKGVFKEELSLTTPDQYDII